jgi:dienelactone hydrolase
MVVDEKFSSGTHSYTITVYPGPTDGKKYPAVLLLHGNGGFHAPFGDQIHGFAKELAKLNYVTAVPGYYVDNKPPEQLDIDPAPHVPILTASIAHVAKRKDVDANRLALIGYSLGAGVAMTYIGAGSPGKINVLADFFGPVLGNPAIANGAGNFPPTIIFHNKDDELVPLAHSKELQRLLAKSGVEHLFVEPYVEHGQIMNHPFAPGGEADVDSRKETIKWLADHLAPSGL